MVDQADLREQVEYYRAIAGEYETHKIDANGGEELLAAFQNCDIGGDVLELTCGLEQSPITTRSASRLGYCC